jgi:hypothetical protein
MREFSPRQSSDGIEEKLPCSHKEICFRDEETYQSNKVSSTLGYGTKTDL